MRHQATVAGRMRGAHQVGRRWPGGALLVALASLSCAPLVHAQVSSPYTTNYVWDANRRLTMTIAPDPGSGVRVATKYTYDTNGELIETDKGTTTQSNGSDFAALETTTYAYDAAGNQIQAHNLDGAAASPGSTQTLTQMSYDADERLQCSVVRMNSSAFSSSSLAAQPVSGSSAASTLPTSACSLGTPGTQEADRITETVYDAAGQTVQIIHALHDPTTPVSLQEAYATYSYTPNGKQQYVIDARGNRSRFVYDGFDREIEFDLPSTTLPANYNPATQATALSTAGSYDVADRELYTYDANSNRIQLTKRDGVSVISWCYDALNREVEKYLRAVSACTTSPTGNEVASTYDLLNRRLSATYAGGVGVTYQWDAAGRLLREATNGQQMAYQYDAAGNRTRVTWPDNFYAAYAYDPMNRVTTVSGSVGVGQLATYSYDNLGRRLGVARGNGTSTAYGYDAADRLTSLSHTFPAQTTSNQGWTYSYNPANQSIGETASNDAYKWTNHPALTVTQSGATFDGLNRNANITSLLPPGTTCSPSVAYDCKGNLINDSVHANTYDTENRLLSVTNVATSTTLETLVYDPLGRLLQETAGSAVTQFLYDGDRLSAEFDGSGNLLRRYVHGPGTDEPIVWYEGLGTAAANARWLHADREGSIIAWSDSTGAVNAGQIYAYGPYGEPNAWGGSRFAYTGQIQLPGAQLYHYKARVYDPATGRFLQTDPVGYKDDVNLYAYVHDDPVDHADPTGLTCTGTGDDTSCHIDQVVTPKDRPLTKQESAQIKSFNAAYTSAVKTLQANAGKTVSITVGGKTFEVKAGDVAKSLAGRTFVAEVGSPGTAGTAANGTTYVFSQGLAGTVGPQSERGQTDREITTVHEGIHRGPSERQAFPNSRDPATNQPSHGLPYDNASRELLGDPDYNPN